MFAFSSSNEGRPTGGLGKEIKLEIKTSLPGQMVFWLKVSDI